MGFLKTTGWIGGNLAETLEELNILKNLIGGLRANVLQQAEGGPLQMHRKLGD